MTFLFGNLPAPARPTGSLLGPVQLSQAGPVNRADLQVAISHLAFYNNLPVYLSNQIEQIQKRALRIIYPSFTYSQRMLTANLQSLYDRRSTLCERLFDRMLDPGHKLNSLVPALRINEHNLRHNRCFKVPVCRTDRYHKSFIPSV
jgi:hypothetical protein